MDGQIFRCEPGTQCLNIGTMASPIPGCVRLCSASSTVAAAPYAIAQCANTTATGTTTAVCVPFTGTSTETPTGFCGIPE